MKLFCLSGLGVDHRAFRNIQVEGMELVHIPWIDPLKNETLPSYAKRLFESASIPETYNLIGVSFGGMIAQEFEKIRKPEKLFLISTISSSSELSGLFKFGGKLKLHKIIPRFLLNRANWISYAMFGVKKSKDKQLFRQILHDSNIPFFRWAMGAVVKWDNSSTSKGIKIHGGKDRILPKRGTSEVTIPEAGHFMIVTHGEEVSAFLDFDFTKP